MKGSEHGAESMENSRSVPLVGSERRKFEVRSPNNGEREKSQVTRQLGTWNLELGIWNLEPGT